MQKPLQLKKHWPVILLLFFSFITHFFLWGYPDEAVFDEVHFTSFASSYIKGEYFFDLHPPLAKLLITGFGMLLDIPPLREPLTIGSTMPAGGWIYLRLVPLLAGSLLPLIIYGLCRALRFGRTAAFTAGMLVIFENSLLLQSRFILLDSILLFFGFAGLWLYFLSRNEPAKNLSRKFTLKVLAVIVLSLAFSVKWTGASFIALAFAVEAYDFLRVMPRTFTWHTFKIIILQKLRWFLLFFILPFAVYAFTFTFHFNLLTKSGPGDAFMSPIFQKSLSGNEHASREDIRGTSFMEKFLELNIVMFDRNTKLTQPHDYSSKWYTWPVLKRPIFYWDKTVEPDHPTRSYIYLIGNPFIYIGVLAAVAITLWRLARRKLNSRLGLFLLGGYALNTLPFIFIGRVMFLYHYLAALVFGILLIAFIIDSFSEYHRKTVALTVVTLSLAFFIYFSPLTYGLPIFVEKEFFYFWFQSWR